MADKLEKAERERGELQEALVSAQNQVDDLQYQLDDLSKRWVGQWVGHWARSRWGNFLIGQSDGTVGGEWVLFGNSLCTLCIYYVTSPATMHWSMRLL